MTATSPTARIADFSLEWWWEETYRLLPGEEGNHTVYVIHFYDRCKYFGYTRDSIFYRAAMLAARATGGDTNQFVEAHANQIPYAIRCIKSGLIDLQAKLLRDMLVAQAPDNIASGQRTVVQTSKRWRDKEIDKENTPQHAGKC